MLKLMVTLPPYAPYLKEVARKPLVTDVRYNTAPFFYEAYENILARVKEEVSPKNLWVDLKGRELRTTQEVKVPKQLVRINHKIKLDTSNPGNLPVLWFNEGANYVHVIKVKDGNKLKVKSPYTKSITFGQSMSMNIIHPSLEIEDYLTKKDKEYIEAAKKVGIHKYTISFVEQESDIEEVLYHDPNAEIIAKIESEKGLDFLDKSYKKYRGRVQLMAARGDLYVEIKRPHLILNAMEKIIKADPNAIAASRILNSVKNPREPIYCQDIDSLGFFINLGYKSFLIGDEICDNREAVLDAIGIFEAIAKDYRKRPSFVERLKLWRRS